jgi:hypothetical protein
MQELAKEHAPENRMKLHELGSEISQTKKWNSQTKKWNYFLSEMNL